MTFVVIFNILYKVLRLIVCSWTKASIIAASFFETLATTTKDTFFPTFLQGVCGPIATNIVRAREGSTSPGFSACPRFDVDANEDDC